MMFMLMDVCGVFFGSVSQNTFDIAREEFLFVLFIWRLLKPPIELSKFFFQFFSSIFQYLLHQLYAICMGIEKKNIVNEQKCSFFHIHSICLYPICDRMRFDVPLFYCSHIINKQNIINMVLQETIGVQHFCKTKIGTWIHACIMKGRKQKEKKCCSHNTNVNDHPRVKRPEIKINHAKHSESGVCALRTHNR